MTKISSNTSIPSMLKLGNNTYYYNYVINVSEVITDEGETEPLYEYIQVHLNGQPDYKEIVQAVLREYISLNEEFDLINSYNSYQNNLTEDNSVVSKYLDYLKLVQDIKANIKADLNK